MSSKTTEFDPSVFSSELLQNFWHDRRPGFGQVPASTAEQARDVLFSFAEIYNEGSTKKETDSYIKLFDSTQTIDELKDETEQIFDTISAYDDRIEILKRQAALEGYSLNRASEMAFATFFGKNPFLRLGLLFLIENGNLRAVWKGEDGAHIGLQFLGNGSIQYVIFKQREPSSPMSRVCGRDTVDGVRRQISAFDMDNVLYTS